MIQFIVDYDKVCADFRYIPQTFKLIDFIDKNIGEESYDYDEYKEKYDEKICDTIREILSELIPLNSNRKSKIEENQEIYEYNYYSDNE